MSAEVIETAGRRTTSLAAEAGALVEDGYEVVFSFGEDPSPERVMNVLKATLGTKLKAKLVVRHAELKDYITLGLVGGGMGAGAGALIAGKLALKAINAGVPIDFQIAALLIGGGAVAGMLVGLLASKVTVTVYKYKGVTKAKLVAA